MTRIHTPFRPIFIISTTCIFSFVLLMFPAYAADKKSSSSPRVFNAETFFLQNGMQVVVIPNHRAPVMTHMLWIKAGAADEPESVGGVAHFIEHLMFKGTKKLGPGLYSRRVRLMGGDDNAFTSQDYTAFYVTASPEHLPTIMDMERDRFEHLSPPLSHVASEKQVVIEERRQRTENDPLGALYEQINAYLFASTPYDNPVIGWMRDMERLTWQDAKNFMDTWYAPNNIVLIVSGDVTKDQVQKLATRYYGDWKKRPVPERRRLDPPYHPAATTLNFHSDQIDQPQVIIGWRAPSYKMDKKSALSLQVLQETLDGGAATKLYQDLVVKGKRATGVNFSYNGSAWGEGSVWLSATPANGVSLPDLAQDLLNELDTATKNITDSDRTAAIDRLQRQAVFARDSVSGPAMVIGQAITTGSTLDDVETWPAQIETVTLDDMKTVVQKWLRCDSAKTGCQPPIITHVVADHPREATDTSATPRTPNPTGVNQ